MKVQNLSGVQIAFHDHLLNRPSDFAQEVVGGGRITIEHRLHIYHNAYRVRLLENLQDAYEKTWAYLGDETFEATAREYIELNPPIHRNLRWYGASFPDWLTSQFPDDGDIAELAMVDWELRKSFDAPDATPITTDALARLAPIDWETVGFQFAPSLHVSPILFNTVGIWHAIDQELTPPSSESLAEPGWLLVWRKGWQPHFRSINALENAALSQLLQGKSFAEVCAALIDQFSETETAILAAESLRIWFDDELIVGITGIKNQSVDNE